jgi:Uma2 family endonuclease
MSTVLSPPEARVILHNISWSLYEQLLAAHEDKSSPRFVYDRGELEITVPSYEHEELNRLIDNCIAIIAMEWNIEYCDAGSTTFKREDLERGFEPDSCFYVQHVEPIAGKKRLDLTVDPPPDLVLEVDITHPSLDKLSIFAVVGVPEVWRYDGEHVRMLALAQTPPRHPLRQCIIKLTGYSREISSLGSAPVLPYARPMYYIM